MVAVTEITPIIEDKLRFMRLYLYDIKFIRAGKRAMLRVYIDKPGGVTIDDCEQASNAISVVLDVENFSDAPYTLEVSSPGLDRQLREEKHFKTVIGHYVRLTLEDAGTGSREVIGKLIACENDSVTLELEDEHTIRIPLSEVISGRIDVRFK